MEQLPVELIQQILMALDLASLRVAVLSCRVLFNAFKEAEVPITSQILLRQIDLSVLPEAILVDSSWHLGKPCVTTALKFAEDHLRTRAPAPSQWKLVNALSLARFHQLVDYFANLFANEAFEKQPCLKVKGDQTGPDCQEIYRFQRAFYRFQLYCNVMGHVLPDEDEELREMFFGHFAAWENEQLACIHDYLVRVVAKPFNYLVDHDVTWGYLRVPYIDRHYSEHGQWILSQGLGLIYSLLRARTYQQWHDLLSTGESRADEPLYSSSFLDRGLEKGANAFPMYVDPLSELGDKDREYVIGSPFYNDPDGGPETIWEWVHKDLLPDLGALVSNPGMRHQRQWAYTFWNLSRLQSTGLLNEPSISGPGQLSELDLEEYKTPERLAKLEQSQKSRIRIWELGGWGWWSATNQREVVWSNSNIPSDLFVNPKSIDEAKRFLQD